eukprot:CAMPEP_0184856700 /NCGR_PEP_ID=MMETSP0580-20130426/1879_1 /TAXON_ID=1118495 /ORGANISM="Dactyliosolen fragilissimus" /LENGTH=87 /DNA_ID=CAMNT_0027351869 /DNA_START=48 /DNA_END=308 /DNA_ORIENTATION=+
MASIIEKVTSPAWYKGQVNSLITSSTNYYKPLIRSGSATPLWHLMLFTSTVMYTANYICLKGDKIQAARHEKKTCFGGILCEAWTFW